MLLKTQENKKIIKEIKKKNKLETNDNENATIPYL